MTKYLNDAAMGAVIGGLEMTIDPLAVQAAPHDVDAIGATIQVFGMVLAAANPYLYSDGNLTQGDGFRIPGVSILPA